MPSKVLQMLGTFAQWPMPSDARSGNGISSNFASKAAGAYFERSADCINDQVVCKSCGVQFCSWNTVLPASERKLYESPAAVHRVISPKCPALNPSDPDDDTEETSAMRLLIDSLTSINSPYARYIPSHVQVHNMTPEQSPPTSTQTTSQRAARECQRVLFPESHDDDDDENQPDQEGNNQESEIHQCECTTSNTVSQPSVLDQNPICHPFKLQTGNFDHHFASHRVQTFPARPHVSSAKFNKTWAEEGFVFRREQQDVMCVYCGTVLAVNRHQPGVVHRKVCPTCPLVMGFDVGNISVEQEQFINLMYFKQAAKKHHSDFHVGIRFVQYQNEEDRMGTFQGWPRMCANIFPASAMAFAGFFYSGCSDKVQCYTCGVQVYDWSEEADIWKTHATVSPTCLHVINSKGQDFIAQAANLQVLAEVKYPKDSNAGEVSSSGGVVGEEPGCPVLDVTAVKAAFACGYTLPQIQHAIVKFFCQTSRYPNEAILKASLKATDENHITICKQQQEVQQKDTQLQQTFTQLQQTFTQLQHKDTQLHQTFTQLQHKDTQLHQTFTQLQHKDTQLHQTFTQLQQTFTQLEQKDNTVQTLQHQLDETVVQMSVKDEQLSESHQQLSESHQQLRWQDQQIQSLMQQVQRLRADRQHRAAQGDGANNGGGEDRRHSLVCKICMSDRPRMIFLPCGHVFSCAECTSRLPNKRCPVCRQDISEVLPAFVA